MSESPGPFVTSRLDSARHTDTVALDLHVPPNLLHQTSVANADFCADKLRVARDMHRYHNFGWSAQDDTRVRMASHPRLQS